jgi:hypothetical protein
MICKTVKKGMVGVALGAATLAVLSQTPAWKYMKATSTQVATTVRGAVPIELDIRAARQEVADLEPAIMLGIEGLVKAQIQVEKLDKEIASTRQELNREGREVQALNDHLKTGDTHLTGGVAYTTKEVKTDLVRRMDHYKLVKNILAEKEETLKIRQKNVAAMNETLETMKSAKRDLLVRIEGIEARLNQIRAASAKDEFSFDDTAIGRAKQSVADLESKLEQLSRIDELKSKYIDHGVSVTIDPSRDISTEVEAEFGQGSKSADKISSDKY